MKNRDDETMKVPLETNRRHGEVYRVTISPSHRPFYQPLLRFSRTACLYMRRCFVCSVRLLQAQRIIGQSAVLLIEGLQEHLSCDSTTRSPTIAAS